MDKKIVLLSVILFISLVGFFIIFSKIEFTGKAIAEFEETFAVGEALSGDVSLTIEKGDVLPISTPLLIAVIKDKKDYATITLNLEEFIKKSNNPVQSVEINNEKYFNTEGKYSADLTSFIEYNFDEKGEYTLLFYMPSIDLKTERVIKVE